MVGPNFESVNNSAIHFKTFGRLSVRVLRTSTNCAITGHTRRYFETENTNFSRPRLPGLGNNGMVPSSSSPFPVKDCESGWNSQTFQSGVLRL